MVISILAVLGGLLFPVLGSARERAKTAKCVSNLRQIYTAFQSYLLDEQDVVFWEGANIALDGMDWYVYGGRETGNPNTGQSGLFNNIIPRPLNRYVNGNLEIFHCPADTKPLPWASGYSHFDWVGNSYNYNDAFNALKFTNTRNPAFTVLFLDASLVKATNYWHPGGKANICFADGHISFMSRPTTPDGVDWTWIP